MDSSMYMLNNMLGSVNGVANSYYDTLLSGVKNLYGSSENLEFLNVFSDTLSAIRSLDQSQIVEYISECAADNCGCKSNELAKDLYEQLTKGTGLRNKLGMGANWESVVKSSEGLDTSNHLEMAGTPASIPSIEMLEQQIEAEIEATVVI